MIRLGGDQVDTVKLHRSTAGDVPHDGAQQGAFPRPVAADQTNHTLTGNMYVYIAQNRCGPNPGIQVSNVKHRLSLLSSRRFWPHVQSLRQQSFRAHADRKIPDRACHPR